MTDLFFFGSLRDKALLEVVLGRDVAEHQLSPARAEGFAALALGHEAYPYLAERDGACAVGVLASGLTPADVARLEYFEEAEYGLAPITVNTPSGDAAASYFACAPKLDGKMQDQPWDFEAWQADDRAVAIEAADELMAHFGTVAVEDMDTIWPGIMIRARMRARAKAETPVMGDLRRTRGAGDVDQIGVERPYTRYFAIEEHRLRHRRFDGTWSREIARTALTSGDAVTVLPWDPVQDLVLLIEQFRAPMLARGDACPWGVEVIAGRLDQEGDAEACARREADEEAGLSLGRMVQMASYYTSPGIAAEHVTSFVAEATLEPGEGFFGLPVEDEDIRAFTISLDRALEGIASGEINNAPAILSLLWLQSNRERLADEWCGQGVPSA